MNQSLIHHYTNIAALAAILRHRTIRFSRLDTLDDMQEAQQIGAFDFGRMLFASCWVEKPEEDIAQWAMYGDAMKGVRLSLPRTPLQSSGDEFNPFGMLCQGYILLPDNFDSATELPTKVTYVDDVAAEYAKRVAPVDDALTISGQHRTLATFKHHRWSFQEEVRFVLFAVNGPTGWTDTEEWTRMFQEMASSGNWGMFGPNMTFIDRPLSEEALARGEVVIGPLCTESDRVIVESLVSTLAPELSVRQSELVGQIRHR